MRMAASCLKKKVLSGPDALEAPTRASSCQIPDGQLLHAFPRIALDILMKAKAPTVNQPAKLIRLLAENESHGDIRFCVSEINPGGIDMIFF
ncbi:hypothetical protein [Mesorhizobium sp.]|nr:hypothetical protein [Mesorhizobium sp.]TIQ12529.1 MAG: hypothetical protein E5X57_12630 [Mesorhizobium sp.]